MRTEECLINDLIEKLEETLTREILKDFEKLGYKINENSPVNFIWLEKERTNYIIRITINKLFQSYCKHEISKRDCIDLPFNITVNEHKLLNELFKIWGWL